MLEERLNYLSIPSTEKDIAKSLPYEEGSKGYESKKCIEYIVDVCPATN